MRFEDLPDDTLVSAPEIVRGRGRPGLVPHGREDWRKKVTAGIAPAPLFPLGPKRPLWRLGDLRQYLRKLNETAKA